MRTSQAVADYVAQETQKLARYFGRITHCHVVIVAPRKQHRQCRRYSIHVELGVPHGRLVVTHEAPGSGGSGAPEDIHVTLRDTFDTVRRRLEDYSRRLRGEVKRHGRQLAGSE